jgi:hypothetical protein
VLRGLVVRENVRRLASGAKMYSVFDLEQGFQDISAQDFCGTGRLYL